MAGKVQQFKNKSIIAICDYLGNSWEPADLDTADVKAVKKFSWGWGGIMINDSKYKPHWKFTLMYGVCHPKVLEVSNEMLGFEDDFEVLTNYRISTNKAFDGCETTSFIEDYREDDIKPHIKKILGDPENIENFIEKYRDLLTVRKDLEDGERGLTSIDRDGDMLMIDIALKDWDHLEESGLSERKKFDLEEYLDLRPDIWLEYNDYLNSK